MIHFPAFTFLKTEMATTLKMTEIATVVRYFQNQVSHWYITASALLKSVH